MARVPFIAREDASPAVQTIYDAQEKHLGKVLTTTKVRAHCPEVLQGIAGLQSAQEKSGHAPAALKPLLTLLVSRLNDCPHWVDIHAARSLRAGHEEEKVRNIMDYATSPVFSEAERVAMAYAEGMTKTPVQVSDADFEALKGHFDTPAIVEITLFVGIQNFNAKSNAALQLDINELCPIDVPGGKYWFGLTLSKTIV